MKKRIVMLCLMLLLMLPVGLLGLMNSNVGSRWLLQTIFSSLPAPISVASIEGRLLDRVVLSGLHYQYDTETIAINRLVFAWQPSNLFSGVLKVVELSLVDVDIHRTDAQPSAAESRFDFNRDLQLPLDVVIEKLLIENLKFQQGEQSQQLKMLRLSAFTEQGELKIVSLDVNAHPLTASAKGRLKLGKGFPFSLTADWQVSTVDYSSWQAVTVINGDMQHLVFDNQLAAPFKLALKGTLDNLQNTPQISAEGEWQDLNWPLTGRLPQVTSKQGSFELTGMPNAYHIKFKGDLTRPSMPKAQLVFEGRGSTEHMSIETLTLKSASGTVQLGGRVSWKSEPDFDLTASGQQFNPAILSPDFPGSLTFNSRFKGKLAGTTLQLDADILKLSGQLRGYPVSANGKLALADELLSIEGLKVNSGVNKIAVDGSLGQAQAALQFAIDAPDLASLWPKLSGSFKGDGILQGAWKNPSVKLQAKGKRLQYAENSVEQLAIDINYLSDVKKTSKLQLSATSVVSGKTNISTLSIDGSGTLEQHAFNGDIRADLGDISMAMTGSLKGDVWQGKIPKLILNANDFGRWQLKDTLAVRVAASSLGVNATLSESCLVQQDAAAICMQGNYIAKGDFQAQMKTTSLPASLTQVLLPESMRLKGNINASADIQRQKGSLSGTYQLTMPGKTKIRLETSATPTELALGALSLSGKIKGAVVSADYDLSLVDQDYVRGHLQLDTGKAQTISGQINASLVNFALLQAFTPQLANLKGTVQANLALQGTLEKPLLDGTIALSQGAVDISTNGFGLRSVTLKAQASGKHENHFVVQGSVIPILLNNTDTPEQMQFKGIVNVNADLQQQANLLVGSYQLDMPANASLSMKTAAAETKIVLGASSLSGHFNSGIISADLNLALAAQDYLQARLQLDTGENHAIIGQVSASVVDLALLNAFAPQLSNLNGQLKSDLTVTGSTEKPVINGLIGFTEGAVDIAEIGVKLREIKFQALSSAEYVQRFQLSGSAKSGQGTVKLEGFADLQGNAEIMLHGTDFEVAKLPEAQVTVSPDLKLLVADNRGKVSGQLKIPKALLTLKEIPENAVKVSADEVILGEEKTQQYAAVPFNIDADITVELGEQVKFSGQGLETNLSGQMKLAKVQDRLTMRGHVDMAKARYKSYGQDLTVRKGQILFNGPVDKPWLDLEAIRVSKDKTVTAILSLTGQLDAPKMQLSSQPALPEADVLAYLVTGGPLNQVSKSEGNLVASAALSYGAGKVSWIADKLGIDEFEVKEGKTLQDTLLAVGQYLTPDFYVGTRVGLFNKQVVLVLKHKLTKTINVETQAGTSQRIKLNYEFDTD